MPAKTVVAAGVLALVAVAIGALYSLRRPAAPTPPAKPAAVPQPPAGDLVVPARIRARKVTAVAVPVEGTVESLLADVGDEVYEGQLLGRIGNASINSEQEAATARFERAGERLRDLEAKLIVARAEASRARSEAARAQADLDRADRARQRQQMLVREGATPRLVYERSVKEYEAARQERDIAAGLARGAEDRLDGIVKSVEAARQTAEAASDALDHAKATAAAAEIHSPVTGLVVARTRRAGDAVDPDVHDLFQIASDLSALEAVAEPAAADLARVRAGQEALVTLADAPDAIPAQVAAVNGNEVVIPFTSPNPAIRPGATAQVRIRM
ncbi:MAG: HlyD family secretion protein [Acidobacteriota bacterium]